MELKKRSEFKYAKLYNTQNGKYCTDGSVENLVMGPETQKRFEENTDDCAVTICCITYKHEEFIRDALDGFLMQKTNFKYKIFVGEDHGPDGTADIVREYAEKYPDMIVPFIREENMGAQSNLINLCNHANSPYIAFCEGDDYWTDEYKLQKQYDYMQTHDEARACFCRAEILAPEDWFLRDWFKEDKNGKLIIPECEPSYYSSKKPNELYTCSDCIWYLPAHTSTVFYRWNYDLEIPDWYYRGIIGDQTIFLMQIGSGGAGYIQDVVSMYRRSDVGVYMSNDMDEHFMKTRLDHIRWTSGMLDWYSKHQDEYPKVQLENRIKHETFNYFSTAIKVGKQEAFTQYFEQYPNEFYLSMGAFLSFYRDSRALVNMCTWEGYTVIVRKKLYRAVLRPYAYFAKTLNRYVEKYRNFIRRVRRVFAFFPYWLNTLVPKQENLWVATGFHNGGYYDNTKYFYEYVLEHFPEIDIRWITKDDEVYKRLKKEGKPVLKCDTKECEKVLSRASVAVTDHFAMSDYKALKGFNDKTKVVQLWHGVGFKSMGDENGVRNTTEFGVRYSDDILVSKDDGFLTKIVKKIKYFFLAPFRENFENYFLFVCPGQERIDMIGKIWHVNPENYFMAGHPRDLPVYEELRQERPIKVMYAPTYRFNYQREMDMVDEFLNSAPQVQELMEKINGEFYLRMHPHTWRSYSSKIQKVLKDYDRIFLHDIKDVYTELGTFSIVISDYSSIALDFALLDRPVIFHGSDYDWFVENEAGFNLDFPSVIPGPMTASWEETLKRVEEYSSNLQKDSELREEKLKYFFDKSVNGPDNSARIANEIKRRLDI